MKQAQLVRVRLGIFELDLRSGELRFGNQKTVLQEQPLQILRMLMERDGELVTREEIRKKLWPNDTIVEFDHSINAAIKNLRRALGDSADDSKYIETLARRGYRLMLPVERLATDDSSSGVVGVAAGAAVRLQPEPSLLGKKVSHYRVLEVIGAGGMGLVYKAEDLKLGRQVALKFLPEELVTDPAALQRFEREARTASSLNHPNICTIYEVEEYEAKPFIVMELLDGETLRDRLAHAAQNCEALPLERLLDIGVQICAGLQAAHDKGIIHRDIKPANIFLTDSGQVKILDFGVAKLMETTESVAMVPNDRSADADTKHAPVNVSPHETSLTRASAALGTAGYMSPEQVRGEKLDARTDIFSFGLVLYEMATGQRAFQGETQAVLHEAILTLSPVPVHDINSGLPPKLCEITGKALEKDRSVRYQHVSEIIRDLKTVPEAPGRAMRQRWMFLGVAALVLVSAVASGLYWRVQHHKLTDKDTIVLADFVNTSGDVVFDGTLNEALAAGLEQSPFLNVLSTKKVGEELKLMSQPADARLTPELAQDLCQRSGSKAVLAGSVARLGSHYALGLTATNCYTGEDLAREEVQASDKDHVLNALDTASSRIRQKLGEALGSVQKFDLPVEQVTTSSLEALKFYSLAHKQPTVAAAIPFYRQAIELDPNFALAYTGLGNAYGDMYADELQSEAAAKAFELRDRASERERFEIESTYYDVTTAESDKAHEISELWAQTYPHDPRALLTLGAEDMWLGHYDKAVDHTLKSLALDANQFAGMANLEESYRALGHYQESDDVLKNAQKQFPDSDIVHTDLYLFAFLRGDSADMQKQIAWASTQPEPVWVMQSAASDTNAYFGRLGEFREYARKAIDAANLDQQETAALLQARKAQWEAEFGFKQIAATDANEALHYARTPAVKSLVGLALAQAGEQRGALQMASDLDHEFSERSLWRLYWSAAIRASVEVNKGNPERAVTILEASQPNEGSGYTLLPGATLYPAYIRGEAYLAMRRGADAAGEFQKFLNDKGILANCPLAALARLGLARAYVIQSDTGKAKAAYKDFLTLWKDADPDIPIYKEAKAEYAKLQ